MALLSLCRIRPTAMRSRLLQASSAHDLHLPVSPQSDALSHRKGAQTKEQSMRRMSPRVHEGMDDFSTCTMRTDLETNSTIT